jgi:putative ABC transport system permease protein
MIEPALLAVDKGRTFRVQPLDDIKDGYFSNQRAVVAFMSILVGLLVLVTSLGIVGLTAFSVAERTRHIGTRRALGARRIDIVRHFLLENWLLTTMGLTLGILLAFGINIGLVSSTAGTKIGWALPLAGVAVLWVAGIAATLAPALRASRISPAVATRNV